MAREQTLSDVYNRIADVKTNKQIEQYDLKPDERQKIDDIRTKYDNEYQKEAQEYRDPDARDKRTAENFNELKTQQQPEAGMHLTPPGQSRMLDDAQLMHVARDKTRTDHMSRIDQIDRGRQSEINDVLREAADDGRGPNRDRDQDRGQDRDQDHDRR